MVEKGDRQANYSARALAARIRLIVLDMVTRSGASHIGSCFSIADILAVLYAEVLRFAPARPDWPERDRFILSKGHACAALYATLGLVGFFPKARLETFYQNGSELFGHATHNVPGVEVSTGSLGHGLPMAVGMALSATRRGQSHRVFALLSDGECDEGSTWEAAMFAGHHNLGNLTVILDYNRSQALGRVEDVLELEPLSDKWCASGWVVEEVDGHDLGDIGGALAAFPLSTQSSPTCIIAHTVKGKGVSFMEDEVLWHYRAPDIQEYQRAREELLARPGALYYDYDNQAWVVDGHYTRCGHPEAMDCQCYGRLHEGEASQRGVR